LRGSKAPCRLRLNVTLDGRAPSVAWEAFLDRLFDHFDRDADGYLSPAETARIMPLPLPCGKELTIDFDRLDTNKDGRASRAELKAFCRSNGFTPVVVVVTSPSADDERLAELFRRCLNADGDGQLTSAELNRMPRALGKFDLNDDEYLDLAELLAGADDVRRSPAARLRVLSAADQGNAELRVDFGTKGRATLVGSGTGSLRLVPAAAQGDPYRLDGGGRWWLTFRAVQGRANVRSAGDFLIAQFKAALGNATSLAKADMQEDAALAGFLDLLPYADRNGDNRLSLAELKAYLDLVLLGMGAQVWVTATDRDCNLFPFLDHDGDGRLSYREQIAAAELLGGRTALKGLPAQFELSFGGPAVKSWGGVAIPAVRRPRAGPTDLRGAPAWFRAMDRNGDGVLSPREFLGPPELFRQLDVDGDGVISIAEAARAASH
jgi:Ca2+-binding EF-hand superfamily protein